MFLAAFEVQLYPCEETKIIMMIFKWNKQKQYIDKNMEQASSSYIDRENTDINMLSICSPIRTLKGFIARTRVICTYQGFSRMHLEHSECH